MVIISLREEVLIPADHLDPINLCARLPGSRPCPTRRCWGSRSDRANPRTVGQGDRASAADLRRLQQRADIAAEVKRIIGRLQHLIGGAAKGAELLAGAVRRAQLRPVA